MLLYWQPSWVTDEEFGMGYLEIKPAPAPTSKSLSVSAVAVQDGAGVNDSPAELMGSRHVSTVTLHSDSGSTGKDLRTRSDGRIERTESTSLKSDPSLLKLKGGSINGMDVHSLVSSTLKPGISRSVENLKQMDESANKQLEENSKVTAKTSMESEVCCEEIILALYSE